MVGKSYDLEERTAKFAEEILKFVAKIPRSAINGPLVTSW